MCSIYNNYCFFLHTMYNSIYTVPHKWIQACTMESCRNIAYFYLAMFLQFHIVLIWRHSFGGGYVVFYSLPDIILYNSIKINNANIDINTISDSWFDLCGVLCFFDCERSDREFWLDTTHIPIECDHNIIFSV